MRTQYFPHDIIKNMYNAAKRNKLAPFVCSECGEPCYTIQMGNNNSYKHVTVIESKETIILPVVGEQIATVTTYEVNTCMAHVPLDLIRAGGDLSLEMRVN